MPLYQLRRVGMLWSLLHCAHVPTLTSPLVAAVDGPRFLSNGGSRQPVIWEVHVDLSFCQCRLELEGMKLVPASLKLVHDRSSIVRVVANHQ